VLPPAPKVGGRLRLALGAPPAAGTLAFVLVRSEGASLGIVRGVPLPGTTAPLRLELPIPDVASLAGRKLQLRVRLDDPLTGSARWSEEREIVLDP
jgi:hypothetical protein